MQEVFRDALRQHDRRLSDRLHDVRRRCGSI
jgi:hypothetical protein